ASWLAGHRREPDPSPLRLALTPPPGVTVENAQISPDGKRVAFVGREGDVGRVWDLSKKLWIQQLDSTEAGALPGTEGALNPFWAADSQSVAFIVGFELKRINVSGGPVKTLGPAIRGAAGGSWNRGDVVLYSKDFFEPLYQMAATGGKSVPVT